MNMICCPHCRKEFEPLVLDGAKPKGRTLQTFDQWIASLNGADAIPEDHHVFKFADAAKIPREFVELMWLKFEREYTGNGKKYKAWPDVFRKAVEKPWYDFWRINRAGEYYLTTAGQAFQRSLGAQCA